jgi:hypothetical protein
MGQRALERRTFGTNQDTSVDKHKQIRNSTRESWQYPCYILFVVMGTTSYMSMVSVFSIKEKKSIFLQCCLFVDG